MPAPTPPKVFISYSHDSPAHAAGVLGLADRLRGDGIDALIDQYEPAPEGGWTQWMTAGIQAADFVLMVCTARYRARFEGDEAPGLGKGVRWEGGILRDLLYRAEMKTTKQLVVLLHAGGDEHIPLGYGDRPRFDLSTAEGYTALLRTLTNQPASPAGPLGPRPQLPPRARSAAFEAAVGWAKMVNVPQHNGWFRHRDAELAALEAALYQGHPGALTQPRALTGHGGVGKTQVALAYAWRHVGDYEHILWADASSDAALAKSFLTIGRQLGVQVDGATIDAVRDHIHRWLTTQRRWLFIFDNADTPSLLKAWWPQAAAGHRLLTSRARSFPGLGGVQRHRVGMWTPQQTLSWLLERTGLGEVQGPERAAAQTLAHALGGLPLAASQAAAYIEEEGERFQTYLRAFQDQAVKVLERGLPDSDYPQSVATTWQLAMERVEGEHPASAQVLRLAAFLDPDAIPETLFVEGVEHLVADAIALVKAEGALAAGALIGPLHRLSLVERDPATASFSVHRLVQEVTRWRLGKDARLEAAMVAVHLVADAFPSDPQPVEVWPWLDQLVPQGLALLEQAALKGVHEPRLGEVFSFVGQHAERQAQYETARMCYERALKGFEVSLGEQHPRVASVINNLGSVHEAVGRLSEARGCYERALAIDEAALGAGHPSVARDVNNLGGVHWSLGKLKEARRYYERALAIDEAVLGARHPSVARDANDLGSVHRDLGELEEAQKCFERALVIDEATLGSRHPNVAIDINNLGSVYKAMGELEEARKCFERALEIDESALGARHPSVARDVNNLGSTHKALGEYEEAMGYYERALSIGEAALGVRHPSVATYVNNLGMVHKAQGKLEEARSCLEIALAIFMAVFGADHPRTRLVEGNLARLGDG